MKKALKAQLIEIIQRRMDKNNLILVKGKEKMDTDFAYFFQYLSLEYYKLSEENKRLSDLILLIEECEEQKLKNEMTGERKSYLNKILGSSSFSLTTNYMVNTANSCNAEIYKDLYTFCGGLVNTIENYKDKNDE